jgi:predicted nucleic acid-binding protein
LTPQLLRKALQLYKDYKDKEWSLVDCISFIVMKEVKVDHALAFDKHFTQAGFQIITSVTQLPIL